METLRQKVRQIIFPVAKIFAKWHPNVLTFIGFIITCFASFWYAKGWFRLGGVILFIGGMFDMIDGMVARIASKKSKFGAFFDSCLDRYSDFLILFGMFWWYIGESERIIATLVLLAILGSYMVSYAAGRAEGLGYKCRVGIGDRGVRTAIIIIGSLFGAKIFIGFLLLLVIVANGTGFYRIWWMWKETQKNP
jgi:CDP-diacylglycerol--glycerol-3-phosphate 3-phosphatidyltransferase